MFYKKNIIFLLFADDWKTLFVSTFSYCFDDISLVTLFLQKNVIMEMSLKGQSGISPKNRLVFHGHLMSKINSLLKIYKFRFIIIFKLQNYNYILSRVTKNSKQKQNSE